MKRWSLVFWLSAVLLGMAGCWQVRITFCATQQDCPGQVACVDGTCATPDGGVNRGDGQRLDGGPSDPDRSGGDSTNPDQPIPTSTMTCEKWRAQKSPSIELVKRRTQQLTLDHNCQGVYYVTTDASQKKSFYYYDLGAMKERVLTTHLGGYPAILDGPLDDTRVAFFLQVEKDNKMGLYRARLGKTVRLGTMPQGSTSIHPINPERLLLWAGDGTKRTYTYYLFDVRKKALKHLGRGYEKAVATMSGGFLALFKPASAYPSKGLYDLSLYNVDTDKQILVSKGVSDNRIFSPAHSGQAFTRDSRYLFFLKPGAVNNTWELWSKALPDGTTQKLRSGLSHIQSYVAHAAIGNRIVYSSDLLTGGKLTGKLKLEMLSVENPGKSTLFVAEGLMNVAVSAAGARYFWLTPDGRTVLYRTQPPNWPDPNEWFQTWARSVRSSKPGILIGKVQEKVAMYPWWNGDKTAMFGVMEENGPLKLYLRALSGGERTYLGDTKSSNILPVTATNNERTLFYSIQHKGAGANVRDLYSIENKAGSMRKLLSARVYNYRSSTGTSFSLDSSVWVYNRADAPTSDLSKITLVISWRKPF